MRHLNLHAGGALLVFALSLSAACRESDAPPIVSSVSPTEEPSTVATAPRSITDDMENFENPVETDTPKLTELVRSGDKDARKEAALALGTIGSQPCITPMLVALADDDDYVRSYAMMGIERGIEANRCTREFLDAMFPAIEKLVARDDSTISGKAPELLLAISPERALPTLLAPQHFTPANSQLHYIVRALNRHGTKIPHENLLPLLGEIKTLIDKYPHDYEYAELLVAYAHHPDAQAEEVFRTEMESQNKEVKEAAAKCLAILAGVVDPYNVVASKIEESGFESLTEPQKHYSAVSIYDAEVNNGGHSQYFWNSSGNNWKLALAGLLAIGSKERAQILQEAAATFGPLGPSENRRLRQEQLPEFPKRSNRLDDLDTRYYDSKENIELLLSKYAIEHYADFMEPDRSPN
jgi:HEAT repeat protein